MIYCRLLLVIPPKIATKLRRHIQVPSQAQGIYWLLLSTACGTVFDFYRWGTMVPRMNEGAREPAQFFSGSWPEAKVKASNHDG